MAIPSMRFSVIVVNQWSGSRERKQKCNVISSSPPRGHREDKILLNGRGGWDVISGFSLNQFKKTVKNKEKCSGNQVIFSKHALKEASWALAGIAQWTERRLRTKGLLVQFPVGAYTWVVGQVPQVGAHERQPHTDISLPLFLLPFPSLKINKLFKL